MPEVGGVNVRGERGKITKRTEDRRGSACVQYKAYFWHSIGDFLLDRCESLTEEME